MKKKLLAGLAVGVMMLGMTGMTNATPVTSTTGDFGNKDIFDAGSFEVFLDALTPSNSIYSTLVVTYGLSFSPDVTVNTYFNETLVGTFTADQGYKHPGFENIQFDITGFLSDGNNTIRFDRNGIDTGKYVIKEVAMNYDNSGNYAGGQDDINHDNPGSAPVPEPATMLLMGTGLAGLIGARRKMKA